MAARDPIADRRDVQQQIDDLTRRVERLEVARSTLTARDREQLLRLLPLIAASRGSQASTAREIVAIPAVHLVLGDLSVAKLGHLLRRGRDQDIGGLVVRRVGSEHRTALWSVEGVIAAPESPRLSGVSSTIVLASSSWL